MNTTKTGRQAYEWDNQLWWETRNRPYALGPKIMTERNLHAQMAARRAMLESNHRYVFAFTGVELFIYSLSIVAVVSMLWWL